MIAQNSKTGPNGEGSVRMWVRPGDYEGRNIVDIINETHEHPKYLPGIPLPENLKAVPDLVRTPSCFMSAGQQCLTGILKLNFAGGIQGNTVSDADVLVICVPHQFVKGVVQQMSGKVKPGAIAISLVKGMRVRVDGPQLISTMIKRTLGIDVCVLMGANIAEEVAREEFAEAVIGEPTPLFSLGALVVVVTLSLISQDTTATKVQGSSRSCSSARTSRCTWSPTRQAPKCVAR